MEEYLLYIFYVAIILLLGIVITAVTNKLRISNILFLVIAGYSLSLFNLALFSDEVILVLSSLALVVIVLETTMRFDLFHIVKNFLHVLYFSLTFFFICIYTLTLFIFQFIEFPGKNFQILVLSLLLSIIIYGADPNIVMEFFKKKKSKVKEILEIEGLISGPIVVIFAFFIIDFLSSEKISFAQGAISQLFIIFRQVMLAFLIAISLAYIVNKLIKHFTISQELYSLAVLTLGTIVFVLAQFFDSNGSLAVAFFAIFLITMTKRKASEKFNSVFAHTLYLIVFIFLGMKFVIPGIGLWVEGLGLFLVYLLLRFASVVLFFKQNSIREKLFITLNTAKGIEVAFVLLVMDLNFQHIPGLTTIVSLGFLFFILSYIVSTITNYFSDFFLIKHRPSKN